VSESVDLTLNKISPAQDEFRLIPLIRKLTIFHKVV